jgi:aspartyl-tRNA(Asn)/glutamyl-tRNA(Gln) amidotransferase subunit B
LKLEQNKTLLDNQLKIVFNELLTKKTPLTDIVKEYGFDAPAVNNDDLITIIQEVLNENPTILQQYKNGKETTIGFFVGQVMKKTGGKVNPQIAQEELKKQLKVA